MDNRSLTLSGRWPSAAVPLLCKALGELTHLEDLTLLENPSVSNEILAAVSLFTQLTSLHLSKSSVHSYSPAALRSTIDALSGLRDLSLGPSPSWGAPEEWNFLSVASLMRIAAQPNKSFPSPCVNLASRATAVKALLGLYASQSFSSFAHRLEACPVPVSRLCALLVSGFWGFDPAPDSLPAILALQGDITHLLWELSKKDFGGREGMWDCFWHRPSALYSLFLVLSDPKVGP